MKLHFLYFLCLLYVLADNVLCKKKKNKILGNIPKNGNLVDRLSFMAKGEHRNILSEVDNGLLKKLDSKELVTKDMLIATLKLLDSKYKETKDESKKKGIEKLVLDIKNALKKNSSKGEYNEEDEEKRKQLNKKIFLLKMENSCIKRDLANFKKIMDDIRIRKTYLEKKFKVFSTSSEKLLFGAPGELNLSDSNIKDIDYESSIKITSQISSEEYFSTNKSFDSYQFNKLVDLYKPLLDFNLELVERELKNELKTYEDSKKQFFFLIRDHKQIKRFSLNIPMSIMPNAKPNDEMSKKVTEDNQISTYTTNKIEKEKTAEEHVLGRHSTEPVYIHPKRFKKVIKIPVKKKKKGHNNKVQINVKSPLKVGHLILKNKKEDHYPNTQNNSEYHIFLKKCVQKKDDYSTKRQYDIPVEHIIVSKPLTNGNILKKIIIKKFIEEEPIAQKGINGIHIPSEDNSSHNTPEYSQYISDFSMYGIPSIHFNYPSGSMHCISCSNYDKNSHDKGALNENMINLNYDKNCLICIPANAINKCICNINHSNNEENDFQQKNSDSAIHGHNGSHLYDSICANCSLNNNIFSLFQKNYLCPYCKYKRPSTEGYSSSKLVNSFSPYASSQGDFTGQTLSNFEIVNDGASDSAASSTGNGASNIASDSTGDVASNIASDSTGDAASNSASDSTGDVASNSASDSANPNESSASKQVNMFYAEDWGVDSAHCAGSDVDTIADEEGNNMDNRIIALSSTCFDKSKLKRNSNGSGSTGGQYDDEEEEEEDTKEMADESIGDRKDVEGANTAKKDTKSGNNNEDKNAQFFKNEKIEMDKEQFLDPDDPSIYNFSDTVRNDNDMGYFRKLYYSTVHKRDNEADNREEDGLLFNLRFLYKTTFFTKKKTVVNAYLKTNKVDVMYNKEKILYLFKSLFKKIFKDIDYKIKESLVKLLPIVENADVRGFDMDFGKVQTHYAASINMFKHSIFDIQNMAIYFISPDKKYILLEDVIKGIHDNKDDEAMNDLDRQKEIVEKSSPDEDATLTMVEQDIGNNFSDVHNLEEEKERENKVGESEKGEAEVEEVAEREMETEAETEMEAEMETEMEEEGEKEMKLKIMKEEKSTETDTDTDTDTERMGPKLSDTTLREEECEKGKAAHDLGLLKILSNYGNLLSREDINVINDNIKNITVNKRTMNGGEIIEIVIKRGDEEIDEENAHAHTHEDVNGEVRDVIREDALESITIDGSDGLETINDTVRRYMEKYFSVHNIPIYYIEDRNISKNIIYVTSDVNCDLDMLKMSILGICNITGRSTDDFKFFLLHKEVEYYDPHKLQEIPSSIRNVKDLHNYSKSLGMKIVIASIHEEDINSLRPKSFDYLFESSKEEIPLSIEKEEHRYYSGEKKTTGEYDRDAPNRDELPPLDKVKLNDEYKKHSLLGSSEEESIADNMMIGKGRKVNKKKTKNDGNTLPNIHDCEEDDVEYVNKEITILEDEEIYKKGNYFNFFDIYIDNPSKKITIKNAPILKTYTLNLFIIDIMNKIVHVPSIFINTDSYKKGMYILDIYKCLEYYSYNKKIKEISSLVFENYVTLYEVLKHLNKKEEYLLIKNKDTEECLDVDNLRDILIPNIINLKDSKYIHLEIPLFYLDERSNFYHDRLILKNVSENMTVLQLCTQVRNILNDVLISFNLNTLKDIQLYIIKEKQWENVEDSIVMNEIKINYHNLYTLFVKNQFLTKYYFQVLSNLVIDLASKNMYVKKLGIFLDYNFSPYVFYNLPIHMTSTNLKFLFLQNTNSFLSDSLMNEFFFTYNKKYTTKVSSKMRNCETGEDTDVHIYEGDESKNTKKIAYLFLLNMLSSFYKIKLNSSKMMESVMVTLFELSGKSSSDNSLLEVKRSSKKVKTIELYLGNNCSNKIVVKNVPLNLLIWKFINTLMRGSFNVPIEDKEKLHNLFLIVPKEKEKVLNHDYYFTTTPGYTIEELLKIVDKNNLCLIKAYHEQLNHIKNSEHYDAYILFNLESLPSIIDFNSPVGSLSFYVNYKNENKITHIINVPENITTDKLLKSILLDMYSKWQKLPKDEKIKFSLYLNNDEITDMRQYINSGEGAQLRTLISLGKKKSDNKSLKKKYVDLDKISEVESINFSDTELKSMQLYDSVLREILVKDYIDFNNISLSGYTISIYVYDGTAYKPVSINNVPLSATNKDIINFLLVKANHVNTKKLVDEFLLLNEDSFILLKTKNVIDQNVVFIGELTELINMDRTKLYLVHKPLFNPLDDLFKNIANKSYDFKSEKIQVLNISEEKGNLTFNIMFNKSKKKVITIFNIPYNMYIIEFLRFVIGYQRKWIYKFVDLYINKGSERFILNDHAGVLTYGRTISEIFTICKAGDPCTLHIDLSISDRNVRAKKAISEGKVETKEGDIQTDTTGDITDRVEIGDTHKSRDRDRDRDRERSRERSKDRGRDAGRDGHGILLRELQKKIMSDEYNNKKLDLGTISFEYNSGLYEKHIFGTSTICNIPKSYTVGDVLAYITKKLKEDSKMKSVDELELKIIHNDTYITIPTELNIDYVIKYYFIDTPSIVSITENDDPFNIIHLTLNNTIIDIKNETFVKKSVPLYVKNGTNLENIKLKYIPVAITEDHLITYLLNYLTKNVEVINFMRDNTSICVYPRCDPIYIQYEKKQLSFITSLSYHIASKNICYMTTIESFENFYSKMSHFEFNFDISQHFNEKNRESNKKNNIDDLINIDVNIVFPNIQRTTRVKNFNMNMEIDDLLEKIFQSITSKSYKWKDFFTFVGCTSNINISKENEKIPKKIKSFKDYLNDEGNIAFIYKPEHNEINDYLISRLIYIPALINYQTQYVSLKTTISNFFNSSTTMYGFPDYLTPTFMLTLLQYNFFKLIGKTYLTLFGCSYEDKPNDDEFCDVIISPNGDNTSVVSTTTNGIDKTDDILTDTMRSEKAKQQMKLIMRLRKKEGKRVETLKDLVTMEINIACQTLENDEDMEECNDIISSLNTSSIFWRNSVFGFMANSIVIRDNYNNTLMLPYIDYRVNEKMLLQNILEHINILPYLYKLFELTHIDKNCVIYKKELKNTVPHIQCLLSYGFNIYFDLLYSSKLSIYDGFQIRGVESFDITQIHTFHNLHEQHFVEFYIHNNDGTRILVKNVYRDMTVSTLLSELSKTRCHIHGLKYNEIAIHYKLIYIVNNKEFHDISPELTMENVYDLVIKYSRFNIILKIKKKDALNSTLPYMYLSTYPTFIDLSQNYFQVPMFLQLKVIENDNLLKDPLAPKIIINNVPPSTFILTIKEYLIILIKEYFEKIELSQNFHTKFYEFEIDLLILNFNPFIKKTHKMNPNLLNNLTVSNFYNTYFNAGLVLQLDKIKIFKPEFFDDFIKHFSTVIIDFSYQRNHKEVSFTSFPQERISRNAALITREETFCCIICHANVLRELFPIMGMKTSTFENVMGVALPPYHFHGWEFLKHSIMQKWGKCRNSSVWEKKGKSPFSFSCGDAELCFCHCHCNCHYHCNCHCRCRCN
ncbi:liver specific protein 1, putative (LISP1) [Plasmodium ovale curtisi]|uniref:Liver specific protein 1, putative (LISP1) n=1 Tax=Plasmodium ovale curtisi TaxID=864141 RepID=A0A1A8W3L6_PLAOA|nr:liver specific protein 1, putative (LISP1) [Plasmodium ovale curtisi]